MEPISLRSPIMTADQLAEIWLKERHQGWQPWHVHRVEGGIVWHARPDPFGPHKYWGVLDADSAEELSEQITKVEEGWRQLEGGNDEREQEP